MWRILTKTATPGALASPALTIRFDDSGKWEGSFANFELCCNRYRPVSRLDVAWFGGSDMYPKKQDLH
jgi:hypothetical protein